MIPPLIVQRSQQQYRLLTLLLETPHAEDSIHTGHTTEGNQGGTDFLPTG